MDNNSNIPKTNRNSTSMPSGSSGAARRAHSSPSRRGAASRPPNAQDILSDRESSHRPSSSSSSSSSSLPILPRESSERVGYQSENWTPNSHKLKTWLGDLKKLQQSLQGKRRANSFSSDSGTDLAPLMKIIEDIQVLCESRLTNLRKFDPSSLSGMALGEFIKKDERSFFSLMKQQIRKIYSGLNDKDEFFNNLLISFPESMKSHIEELFDELKSESTPSTSSRRDSSMSTLDSSETAAPSSSSHFVSHVAAWDADIQILSNGSNIPVELRTSSMHTRLANEEITLSSLTEDLQAFKDNKETYQMIMQTVQEEENSLTNTAFTLIMTNMLESAETALAVIEDNDNHLSNHDANDAREMAAGVRDMFKEGFSTTVMELYSSLDDPEVFFSGIQEQIPGQISSALAEVVADARELNSDLAGSLRRSSHSSTSPQQMASSNPSSLLSEAIELQETSSITDEIHPEIQQEYMDYKAKAITNSPEHNRAAQGIEKIACRFLNAPIRTYEVNINHDSQSYEIITKHYNPRAERIEEEKINCNSKEECYSTIVAYHDSLKDQNSHTKFLICENIQENGTQVAFNHYKKINHDGTFMQNHPDIDNQNLSFWASIHDNIANQTPEQLIEDRVNIFEHYFNSMSERMYENPSLNSQIKQELLSSSGVKLFFSDNTSEHIDSDSVRPTTTTTIQSPQRDRAEPLSRRTIMPQLMELDSTIIFIDGLFNDSTNYDIVPNQESVIKTFTEIKSLINILKDKNPSRINPFLNSIIDAATKACEYINDLIVESREMEPNEGLRSVLEQDIKNWAAGNTSLKRHLGIPNETNPDTIYQKIIESLNGRP
jgi:hypothetical protein